MNGLTVVYDGWDLVYRPNSPAAIHLLALLDAPLTEWASILVVPGEPFHRTPDHVRIEIVSTPKTSTAHLRWEQRLLPKLAQRVNADLVHWLEGGPSLFSGVRNVVSPAGQPLQSKKLSLPHDKNKFAHRLRDAMAQGGLARASAVFWPVDLPEPELGITTILLPPVSPGWYADKFNTPGAALESQGSNLNLPETYILYHGLTDHHSLVGLLESWSWAAGAIGSYYPILIVGVDDYERSDLESWIAGQGFAETVHLLPPLSKSSLLYVYRNCSAVFHPAQSSPWGGSLRLALSYARPVVALETPIADAIMGPAAYLVSAGKDGHVDTRAMGAAIVTVIVEESVAEELSRAARERSARWEQHDFSEALQQAYLSIVGS